MALCLTAASIPAYAQTSEDRAAARDLLTKKGDAVILVLATLKTRMSINGRENARDSPVQANATVLDGSGLAVMALSVLEPSEAMIRGMAAPGQQLDLKTETAELRMRLADGREVGARIVLRDADLDLAFLRPLEPLGAPIAAVDAAMGKPQVMDLVIALTAHRRAHGLPRARHVRLRADDRGQAAAVSHHVDRPARRAGVRRGRPVRRRHGPRRRHPDQSAAGVLPADDIREIAKQAK
jgi:hypothetical protein